MVSWKKLTGLLQHAGISSEELAPRQGTLPRPHTPPRSSFAQLHGSRPLAVRSRAGSTTPSGPAVCTYPPSGVRVSPAAAASAGRSGSPVPGVAAALHSATVPPWGNAGHTSGFPPSWGGAAPLGGGWEGAPWGYAESGGMEYALMQVPLQEHGGEMPASWQAPGPGVTPWTPQGIAQPDAVALQQEVADLRQQVRSPCCFPGAKAALLLGCSAGAGADSCLDLSQVGRVPCLSALQHLPAVEASGGIRSLP